ncbi:MAG: hypothetical protein J0M15_06435 [Deltaproteobacteria bacterium]|nr:hypothetical protein [Deltaproteobacteria bacterium]
MSLKLIKKLIKLSHILPKHTRHSLLRESLSLPWDLDIGIQFKFITDQGEFMEAIRILHSAYVEKSYMDPDPLKIRLTPYHLMPSTLMAIAKIDGKVAATMSLIRDNPLGLPMEKIFDLSHLRTRGEVLCEFSALAIAPEYRGQGGYLLHSFFRFFYRYIKTWCGVDYFVAAVNPSMADLYEAFYLFEPCAFSTPIDSYQFVKGAPAVPLTLPLNGFETKLKTVYLKKNIKKNLFRFLQSSHANSDFYPNHEYFQIKSTFISPEFIVNLRTEIPDIETRFSDNDKLRIAQSLGSSSFADIGRNRTHEAPRIQINTSTLIYLENTTKPSLARVCDVSLGGIKLYVGAKQKIIKGNQQIRIKLGPNVFSNVKFEPVWQNEQGYAGVKLIETDHEWTRFVNKFNAQGNSTENNETAKMAS